MNKEIKNMNKEIKKVSTARRRMEKLQLSLLKFYQCCREKKSVIFDMPQGNIFSQKAHDNLMKAQVQVIIAELEGRRTRIRKHPIYPAMGFNIKVETFSTAIKIVEKYK